MLLSLICSSAFTYSHLGLDFIKAYPINQMKKTLLIIAFLEGSAVMAMELLSGMMVAPFFGNTIVSWAIVLAVTLGGLAAGYYTGGRLSRKTNPHKTLPILMLLGGALLFLLPYWGPAVMSSTLDLGLEWGLIISLLLFLFPALLVFGSVSPLIIQQTTTTSADAGSAAGSVFGISTGGGYYNNPAIRSLRYPGMGHYTTQPYWWSFSFNL